MRDQRSAISVPDVLVASRCWLERVLDDRTESFGPRSLLQAVLLLKLVDVVTETAGEVLTATLSRARSRIEHEVERGTFDTTGLPPSLLLCCARIFRTHGQSSRELSEFAAKRRPALEHLDAQKPEHVLESMLLYRLGHCALPGVPAFTDVAGVQDAQRLLVSDRDRLCSVYAGIAASTHYGTIPHGVPCASRKALREVLPIVLVQALRAYDLELGAMLLRALHWLEVPFDTSTVAAAEFIAAQQQPDGKFGWFAVEPASGEKFDAEIELHLPTTVNCAWLLTEVLTGVSLLSDRVLTRQPASVRWGEGDGLPW